MNDQFYELTVEKNHLSIIIKALSNYICSQYDGLDAEVVDIPKTMEDIKIAADMQLVLKHHLGGVQHSPKQTAETTGLVWIKDVDVEDIFSQHNDENLQYTNEVLQQAWNNVKERHKDTLQRMSNKQGGYEMNDSIIFAMLWYETMLNKGYRVNNTREEMSTVSKRYDDWCEKFYRGTRWEYDSPDHTELVLGMCEYISKNI